ncbi:MAG: hypothetical protein ACREP9_06405 [Candidatus Dormibacteraceae bacterium]
MNSISVATIMLPVIALCAVLVWLLVPKHKSAVSASALPAQSSPALPRARHYMYFPLIRRALSAVDTQYLLETAPPHVTKKALRERRAVARRFLQGLHEDFSNLASLGRVIAVLSPEVSHEQERERLILSVKFQVLYALVWVRLSTGNLPIGQLENLTALVGRLATRMEEAMTQIGALSAGQVTKGIEA